MDTIGEVREIVRRLKKPPMLDPDGVRRWSILHTNPGGKAGVISAGYLHALAHNGIPTKRWDRMSGISAGAWNNVGYCAGDTEGTKAVYESSCSIPFWFPQGINGDWMNLTYLAEESRSRGIDVAPKHEWPDCHIGISDLRGKLHLPRAQDMESVVEACCASSSIAFLNSGVNIGGVTYVDGGHAHPCPIKDIVRTIYARGERVDILVLANRPHPRHITSSEVLMWQWLSMWLAPLHSWSLASSSAQFDAKTARAAHMATRKRDWISIGMMFPSIEHSIWPIESRKSVVRDAGHRAEDELSELIYRADWRDA